MVLLHFPIIETTIIAVIASVLSTFFIFGGRWLWRRLRDYRKEASLKGREQVEDQSI